MSWLARFDTFQKSKEHVQIRTGTGGVLSLLSLLVMGYLLISEFRYFTETRVEDHLLVDTGQGDREFDIRLDITFHALRCADTDLKVEDQKGIAYDDVKVHLGRQALDASGREVVMGSDEGVACRLKGRLSVKKVAGNFHVAAGRAMSHGDGHFSYAVSPTDFQSYNGSHTINHLAFGPHFPGQLSPLDGVSSPTADIGGAQFQYQVKVVPTLYERLGGYVIDSQQFSATDFVQRSDPAEGTMLQPGTWFRYDFSPIMVRRVETRHSILGLLTSLCGILGGVYMLSGLLDQLVFRAVDSRKQK